MENEKLAMEPRKLTVMIIMLFSLFSICIPSMAGDYKELQTESDGFKWVLVSKDGFKGAETEQGKTLVPPKYDIVTYSYDSDSKYCCFYVLNVNRTTKNSMIQGLYSKEGKELISVDRGYTDVCYHVDYIGSDRGSKTGVCDAYTGKEIIPAIYDNLYHGNEDKYYIVKKDGKEGVIDLKGNEILPIAYDEVYKTSQNYFYVKIDDKKYDTNVTVDGRRIGSSEITLTKHIDPPSTISKLCKELQTGKDGFKWIELRKNGLVGATTVKGKVLFPLKYSLVIYDYDAKTKYSCFYVTDYTENKEREGVYTKEGKAIISLDRGYTDVCYLGNYIRTKRGENTGLCDVYTGKEIIPTIYDEAYLNHEGKYYVVKKDGKEGVCDLKGNKIISTIYDKIYQSDKYYSVEKDGKEGVCDLKGNEIIPPDYESLFLNDNNTFTVKVGYNKYYDTKMDPNGNIIGTPEITITRRPAYYNASVSTSSNAAPAVSHNASSYRASSATISPRVAQVTHSGNVSNRRETSNVSLPPYGDISKGFTLCYKSSSGEGGEIELVCMAAPSANYYSLVVNSPFGMILNATSATDEGDSYRFGGNKTGLMMPTGQMMPTFGPNYKCYISKDWKTVKLSTTDVVYDIPISVETFELHCKNVDNYNKAHHLGKYDPRAIKADAEARRRLHDMLNDDQNESSSRSSSKSKRSSTNKAEFCPYCHGTGYDTTMYNESAAADSYLNSAGTICPYCGNDTRHFHYRCNYCGKWHNR